MNPNAPIRTRLAPSPTGYLHIGTLRTALYAYILAKKHNGSFFLRIEDTDQKRSVEGAVENILNSLHTMGLDPDEGVVMDDGNVTQRGDYGPYVQSERLEIYKKYAQQLLDEGKAYHCFCTPERLEVMRKSQMQQKKAPMYDRLCMGLSPEEVEAKKKEGIPCVVRQKIPRDRKLEFEDLVRGKVVFDCSTIDDQVLVKSDGFPTYHLAHVVDDHLMETNPVIRGEEWLPSLPKHVLLFEALGWEIPGFAHLPLLLNPDKSKLSKRQGDVALGDYLKKGYLPEAILNFVAFLGWNPGTEQEIFSLEELIETFSIERVHKAGAVFDIEKLNWYNQHYIRALDIDTLRSKLDPFFQEVNLQLENFDKDFVNRVLMELQSRLKYLSEAPELSTFFFHDVSCDPEIILNPKMKVDEDIAVRALDESIKLIESLEDFSEDNIKDSFLAKIADLGLKNGQVLWPVRAALTGVQFSPGAFEMIAILGKEKSIERIKTALGNLK